jgi:hypothetical protein
MTERSCLAFQLPVGVGRPRRKTQTRNGLAIQILTLHGEALTRIRAAAGNEQRNTGP